MKASYVVQKMTENAVVFPNPNPLLATLDDQIATSIAAEVIATDGGKDRTRHRDEQMQLLTNMMDTQVFYVQTITNGDPEMTALAGMETRKDPQKQPTPLKPEKLRVTPGDYLGSVYIIFDPVKYRREYVYQMLRADDTSASWVDIHTSGKFSYLHKGLEQGKVYQFRVFARNASGQSPHSNAISCPAR
jgi:hypothetical protein